VWQANPLLYGNSTLPKIKKKFCLFFGLVAKAIFLFSASKRVQAARGTIYRGRIAALIGFSGQMRK
jgi:hypothetical protein